NIKYIFKLHEAHTIFENLYENDENRKVADKLIVSSDREKNLIVNEYGFKNDEVIIAGLARFDRVIKERRKWIKKFKNRNKILMIDRNSTRLNSSHVSI